LKLQDEMAKIVLVIENRQPIPALALSELLAALARDYRKQNRARTLVVARVEDGSIWITLLDMAQAASPYAKGAVEAAKGSKAIIDFGKSLAGLLNAKKNHQDPAEQLQSNAPGRSIEKLVKLAVDANCNVRIRQVEVDGSCLEVEVTRSEAIEIQEDEHYSKEASTLRHPIVAYEIGFESERAAEIADEFERLQISENSAVNDALQIILGMIKRSGDVKLLRSLAVELEGRGYKELAATIREN
jgi:hypothetical protein